MAVRSFLLGVSIILALTSFVVCQSVSNEQKMFTALYKGVEEMVVPTYRGVDSAPTQVILFEMPGLAINRAEYDPLIWSAGGFDARQPDAVAAGFVDRLPYYTGPTFVDSGSFISAIWSHFIYQYIIPIVDDPIQTKKVNDARLALANGTLENAYNAASDEYQAAFNALTTFRSDCLAKQTGAGGGVCSAEGVIFRERLKRKWFTLEVARRDIAAAESKIIALQIQDLKNIFADALYSFASSERVDMGASGFGQSYYLTYFTPSNFWRWWPNAGIFDYSVYADGSVVLIPVPAGSTIFQPPINGFMTDLGNGSYSYRPNAGYTGTDRVGYQTPIPGPGNATTTTFKSIQVVGTDVTIANTAFVSVSTSAGSSSFSSSSFASSFSTSSSFSAGIGWFSASGSLSTSNAAATSATDTVSSSTSLAFDLARVSITRPWLDTSLLSFYPVAIRNLAAQAWSDGTLTPPSGPLQFKFKLLTTAFLVARNIKVTTQFSQSMTSLVTAASSLQASLRVSVGPFFSGSTSVSKSSSSRDYKESSQYSNGELSIRGPQVIGWLCTAIPPFPTAAEDEVRKWEADQVKRQQEIQSGNVTTTK